MKGCTKVRAKRNSLRSRKLRGWFDLLERLPNDHVVVATEDLDAGIEEACRLRGLEARITLGARPAKAPGTLTDKEKRFLASLDPALEERVT